VTDLDQSFSTTVTWMVATATDIVNASIEITSSHSVGDRLPFGDTTITFTAIDDYGNNASCSIVATVTGKPQYSHIFTKQYLTKYSFKFRGTFIIDFGKIILYHSLLSPSENIKSKFTKLSM
jgi:hypothetical protein